MGLQSSLPTPKIPQEFGGYIEYFPNPHFSIEIINGKWGRPKFHLSYNKEYLGKVQRSGTFSAACKYLFPHQHRGF
jgi:hypothetical protein